MATSMAVRILSLALLLLSCAPLASLYAIFMSLDTRFLYQHYYETGNDSNNAAASLTNVLQDPNATLEDLWSLIFFRQRGTTTTTTAVDTYIMASLPALHAHHWTIVLPWGISLVLGVIVPCILSCMSYVNGNDDYDDDDDVDHDGETAWGGFSPQKTKKRLKRLALAVSQYKKILDEQDVDTNDVDAEGVPRWSLPPPGEDYSSKERRKINGLCAICLGVYSCNDSVVWSSNLKCPHAFHEECILTWLSRKRKQCPCCRRTFLGHTEH